MDPTGIISLMLSAPISTKISHVLLKTLTWVHFKKVNANNEPNFDHGMEWFWNGNDRNNNHGGGLFGNTDNRGVGLFGNNNNNNNRGGGGLFGNNNDSPGGLLGNNNNNTNTDNNGNNNSSRDDIFIRDTNNNVIGIRTGRFITFFPNNNNTSNSDNNRRGVFGNNNNNNPGGLFENRDIPTSNGANSSTPNTFGTNNTSTSTDTRSDRFFLLI